MDGRQFLNDVYAWETACQRASSGGNRQAAKNAAEQLELLRSEYALTIGAEIADELCQPLRSARERASADAMSAKRKRVVRAPRNAVGTPAPTREAAELLARYHQGLVHSRWPQPTPEGISWGDFHRHVRADVEAVREGRAGQRILLGEEPVPSWRRPDLSPSARAAAAYQGLVNTGFLWPHQASLWAPAGEDPVGQQADAERTAVQAGHVLRLSSALATHASRPGLDHTAREKANLVRKEIERHGARHVRDLVLPGAAWDALHRVAQRVPESSPDVLKNLLTSIAETVAEVGGIPRPGRRPAPLSPGEKAVVAAAKSVVNRPRTIPFGASHQAELMAAVVIGRSELGGALYACAVRAEDRRAPQAVLQNVRTAMRRVTAEFDPEYYAMAAAEVATLVKDVGRQQGRLRVAVAERHQESQLRALDRSPGL